MLIPWPNDKHFGFTFKSNVWPFSHLSKHCSTSRIFFPNFRYLTAMFDLWAGPNGSIHSIVVLWSNRIYSSTFLLRLKRKHFACHILYDQVDVTVRPSTLKNGVRRRQNHKSYGLFLRVSCPRALMIMFFQDSPSWHFWLSSFPFAVYFWCRSNTLLSVCLLLFTVYFPSQRKVLYLERRGGYLSLVLDGDVPF